MAKAGAFPWEAWKRYAKLQADIQQAAADRMAGYIEEYGLKDRTGAMQYAYWAIGEKYGPAAAEAACEMYDLTARLAGVSVPPAEPAEMPTPEQVTRFVEKAAAQSDANIPAAVGNMVKRAGADTTLKNAARDGAEWAWVPVGDTCAFCRMLASNGWQRQSKKAQARHAEHIHNHCDCQYAVRFGGEGGPAGYDPEKYAREYYDAEGEDWQEKLNTMHRADYAEHADAINAQKRAAYAARQEREKRILRTTEDPIRERLGSAFESHPKEVSAIIEDLSGRGVLVEYRRGAMGYEPNPTPGAPGRVVMDPDASYSAWLHEKTHVLDDESSGWHGFRNFADPEIAAAFEKRAYDIEIDFAESLGYNDIVERLKGLRDKRIKEVLGIG